MFHIETIRRVFQRNVRKLASLGYLEKAGDPSTRDLTGSESKMLKLLGNYIFASVIRGNVQ